MSIDSSLLKNLWKRHTWRRRVNVVWMTGCDFPVGKFEFAVYEILQKDCDNFHWDGWDLDCGLFEIENTYFGNKKAFALFAFLEKFGDSFEWNLEIDADIGWRIAPGILAAALQILEKPEVLKQVTNDARTQKEFLVLARLEGLT